MDKGVPVNVGLALNTTPPVPVDAAVTPVPPLATARVPAKVTAPVVVEFGVNPVVPAEKELTAGDEAHAPALEVNTLPAVLGQQPAMR